MPLSEKLIYTHTSFIARSIPFLYRQGSPGTGKVKRQGGRLEFGRQEDDFLYTIFLDHAFSRI
jgi:hypothetical protein